jgi:Cof subfamily protein (haloacid dehalogenase superfamily)
LLVVTGRMFRSVRPYLEETGIEDPVVCYQGAAVVDPRTGGFLRHEPIPLEVAREAIGVLRDEGFHVNCYVNDELYVAEETPEADRYAGFQNLPLHAVGDLASWLSEPPTKLVTIDEPDVLDALAGRLRARFAGRLYISKSLPYFLELASPAVTKASGLEFLAGHIGFTAERTVAFGDGENDIELLGWAGFGVAVANADPRVLAVADWACPSAAEEGVAQVMESLLDSRP